MVVIRLQITITAFYVVCRGRDWQAFDAALIALPDSRHHSIIKNAD